MGRILTFNELHMINEEFDLSSFFSGEKINALKKKVSDWFNKEYDILDFNSPEGKEKRKKVADDLGSTINKIVDVLHSGATWVVKSRQVYKILELSVFFTLIAGVWSIFFGGEFSLFDPLGNVREAFDWFAWAGFLYILKVIQGFISGVSGTISTLKSIWNWCKSIFKSEDTKNYKYNEGRILTFNQLVRYN